MNNNSLKISLFLLLSLLSFSQDSWASVQVKGELKALKSDGFPPPRVKGIWQYTIAYMAEDGTVVKPGMPVLMFKTDAIQTKLVNSQGKLSIKKSEVANNKANKTELFEKKSLAIEEKKMQLDKASRKADLPNNLIAKNEHMENQLNHELAIKEYEGAKLDFKLTKQKALTENEILEAEIKKLEKEITEYTNSISSMKMFAKSEGIVMHKSGWDNNKFALGDTVWGGRRVIEVANLSKIIAKLEISENNIKHIKKGQKVTVKLDSLPDKEFTGIIASIDQVVRIKSRNQPSKILEAIVDIDQVDTEIMRPGMRLSAVIETGELQ